MTYVDLSTYLYLLKTNGFDWSLLLRASILGGARLVRDPDELVVVGRTGSRPRTSPSFFFRIAYQVPCEVFFLVHSLHFL